MRKQLLESAERLARGLGWETVLVDDQGSEIQMLLAAEGAAEQEICAPLHRVAAELNSLGGPELYPAVEEYDAPEPETAHHTPEPHEDTPSPLEKLHRVQERLAAEPNDLGELDPAIEELDAPKAIHHAPVGIDGLHEDTSGYSEARPAAQGISPKEAATLAEAIDPTGMPLCARPEQLFLPAESEKEEEMNGVLVIRGKRARFELRRAPDGRFVAPGGYEFRVRKNGVEQRFSSINPTAWKRQGWETALVIRA